MQGIAIKQAGMVLWYKSAVKCDGEKQPANRMSSGRKMILSHDCLPHYTVRSTAIRFRVGLHLLLYRKATSWASHDSCYREPIEYFVSTFTSLALCLRVLLRQLQKRDEGFCLLTLSLVIHLYLLREEDCGKCESNSHSNVLRTYI